MGAADIQTIDKFTPDGTPDLNWQPYYLQTSGFWAGDSCDVTTGYYGDSGHAGAHNYYDFSGDTVPNVIQQGRYDTIGRNLAITTGFVVVASAATQILFVSYNTAYPYGVPGTIKIESVGRAGIANPVIYTAAMLTASGKTWEQLQNDFPLAMLEIIDDTNKQVKGLETGRSFRSGYTYRIIYNVPPRV